MSDALKFRSSVLETAKPVTWNTYNRHLRALFQFAVMSKLRDNNPFHGLFVRFDNVPPAEKVIGTQDLTKVLRYLRSSPSAPEPRWFWEITILTLLYSLIRRRQFVELTWEDIQFGLKRIRLRGTTSKNHQSRYIPIHPLLAPKLLELREHTKSKIGMIRPEDQIFNITLFNSKYCGKRMSADQLTGFFKRLANRSGVRISAHRIRHTSATRLLVSQLNGVNIAPLSLKALQELLGHKSIETTSAYLHPALDDLAQLIEQLAAVP